MHLQQGRFCGVGLPAVVDVVTTDDEDSGLRLVVRADDARGFGVFRNATAALPMLLLMEIVESLQN